MQDSKPPQETKTLEMRVSEIEDKLAKLHITEDEMRAYQKVSAVMGAVPTATDVAAPVSQVCIARQQCIVRAQCFHYQCFHYQCFHYNCFIRQQCINECGGGLPGAGGTTGGFGLLGG